MLRLDATRGCVSSSWSHPDTVEEEAMTMKFRPDTALRKRLYVAESMAHPAKAHLAMMQAIIEKYTVAGDTVLDPMAGIGSTLIAALMGTNVICVEMETHFVEPMRKSWEKMRQHPMLGCELGSVEIYQGDARDLRWLWPVDAVITSPPYEIVTAKLGDFKTSNDRTGTAKRLARETVGYTRPSAIITSPPYESSEVGGGLTSGGPHEKKQVLRQKGEWSGYTRKVDAVVTSPPWEDKTAMQDMDWIREHDPEIPHHVGTQEFQKTHMRKNLPDYQGVAENIGNLRSDAYWSAMKQVYQECHRILKPGGVLALVLKGFTRDGQYVDLPAQTQELVESLGFQKFDHWRRELWSLSFWRILQRRRDPTAFDERLKFEEVLAFSKPAELSGNAI